MTEPNTQSGEEAAKRLASLEGGERHPDGLTARFIYVLALAWSCFQLWIASPLPFILGFGMFPDTQARAIHLTFALLLVYLLFPGRRGRGRVGIAPVVYLVFAALTLWMALLGWQGRPVPGTPHVAVLLVLAVSLVAVALAGMLETETRRIPLLDWLLAAAAGCSAFYLYLFHADLAARPGRPVLADLIVAGVGMVTLLEAARRALGPALAVIALVFLIYTFGGPHMPDLVAHRGASFSRAASQFWLSSEGVFGIALGVSTSFVFLFVLFGALLDRAGAGNYFIQVAFSLLGHLRGGPAKAAVVASGMTGIISGSSIANTVTTGTFTIPLMKRVGFRSEKAGAVEVASSVNGQLMPPVMGAAAFLMVEYVGISYLEVIRHAFLPAVISYIALLYIVHLEALKADMKGIPPRVVTPLFQKLFVFATVVVGLIVLSALVYYGIGWIRVVLGPAANLVVAVLILAGYLGLLWNAARYPELPHDDPSKPVYALPAPGPTIHSGLHFILPLVVLIWALIVERLSPGLSAFWAVSFLIFIVLTQRPLLNLLRGRHRYGEAVLHGVRDLLDGMVQGARNMVGIGVATAAAGIIVGTVSMTGVGLVLTQVVEVISGGNLMLMLMLVAVLSLVLGLGLPTTANYIIVASLMAPVVVELGAQAGLLVPLIAVHLFVFYFGIMADVTPPVGLASFAAAAVARGDPIRTGVYAFYYSLRTVALPFLFIFNTQLLLIGVDNVWDLALTFVSATIAMLVFAAATQGYFVVRTRWYEVAALLLVAFTLFRPGYWMDRVAPEFEAVPAHQAVAYVDSLDAGDRLRFQVEGMDAEGREVSRLVMLRVDEEGDGFDRLQDAGVMIMVFGEQVQVSSVSYGSQADRVGISTGQRITEVLMPAERPDPRWFFLPALGLLGTIWWWQRRRAGRSPHESG
ncbi:MAG: TRAP transporter permease [Ectothiorhodospiraceae bacterium]|nr:TRAP transporter permease [Ectothiorhodospiraceae bacterium]